MSILSQLQDQLDQSREVLLTALEDLPDAALVADGAVGELSVADLLALLTAWEAELVTGLMRLDQRKKPQKLLAALADREAYNTAVLQTNQRRDLDRIFNDFQHVRLQLETWLEEFTDRELKNPKQFKWFQGKPLKQIVAETTFELERRYLPEVTAFAQQWLALSPFQPEAAVPLTAVVREYDDDDTSSIH